MSHWILTLGQGNYLKDSERCEVSAVHLQPAAPANFWKRPANVTWHKNTPDRHVQRQLPEVTARKPRWLYVDWLRHRDEKKALHALNSFHMFPHVSIFPSGFRQVSVTSRTKFGASSGVHCCKIADVRICRHLQQFVKPRADTWGVTTVTTWHTKPVTPRHKSQAKCHTSLTPTGAARTLPEQCTLTHFAIRSQRVLHIDSGETRRFFAKFCPFWDDNSLKLTAHPLKHPRRQKWSVSFVKFPPFKSGHPLRPVLSIDLHSKAGDLVPIVGFGENKWRKWIQIGRSCHILP